MLVFSPPKKKLKKVKKTIDFYLHFRYNYIRGGGGSLIKKDPPLDHLMIRPDQLYGLGCSQKKLKKI